MINPVPDKMVAVFVNYESRRLSTEIVDVPVPKKGEVLVKMLAAPVNPADLAKVRELKAGEEMDFIPGTEGCGIVVASGGGLLPGFYMGKRVACSSHYRSSGSWAEYMVTTAGSCFPVGKKITDEQAAMSIVNPMTALALQDIARKGKHKAVVSTAAAGALGTLIASVFEDHRIEVLNIVRNESAVDELMQQKRRYILSSDEPGFELKIKEWCEKMHCTLMLDAVGGEMVNRVLDYLPDGTTILIYGNLSQKKVEFLPPQLVRKNKKIVGFVLSHWIAERGMIKALTTLIKANRMIRNGAETSVQGIFPLERAQEAVEAYQVNMGKGKVILKPPMQE